MTRKRTKPRKLKNIIVTTDLSAHSLAALEMATSLADQYHATLSILYVADESPPPMIGLDSPQGREFQKHIRKRARALLTDFVASGMKGRTSVRRVVRVGDPPRAINRFAAGKPGSVVVMATHGHTGLAHVLLGSVTEQVVRTSSVPVVTVKPKRFLRAKRRK